MGSTYEILLSEKCLVITVAIDAYFPEFVWCNNASVCATVHMIRQEKHQNSEDSERESSGRIQNRILMILAKIFTVLDNKAVHQKLHRLARFL